VPGAALPVDVPAASAEVEAFVAQLLADRTQPLVLFALEWCEFCWSLRKLFAKAGIPYRSIDLDSTAFQRDDRGGQIRKLLRAKTGAATIPQVFVAGEWLGGCTDTLDAFKSGKLQAQLTAAGVRFDDKAEIEPHALLPGWIHPR